MNQVNLGARGPDWTASGDAHVTHITVSADSSAARALKDACLSAESVYLVCDQGVIGQAYLASMSVLMLSEKMDVTFEVRPARI